MSRFFWAALLLLLLVGNLVISAPARLLSLVVPAEQVLLYGLSGTVWRGSASSAMLRLPQGYLHLRAVVLTPDVSCVAGPPPDHQQSLG